MSKTPNNENMSPGGNKNISHESVKHDFITKIMIIRDHEPSISIPHINNNMTIEELKFIYEISLHKMYKLDEERYVNNMIETCCLIGKMIIKKSKYEHDIVKWKEVFYMINYIGINNVIEKQVVDKIRKTFSLENANTVSEIIDFIKNYSSTNQNNNDSFFNDLLKNDFIFIKSGIYFLLSDQETKTFLKSYLLETYRKNSINY